MEIAWKFLGNVMKKRLFVEVDEELHKIVKIRAIERNITLSKWILRAIKQALKQEQQYD